MIIKEWVDVKQEKVVDVICNNCSNSLKSSADSASYGVYCGIPDLYLVTSYWSKVFDDEEEYEFSLCEPCLKKMFKKFKIQPTCKKRW